MQMREKHKKDPLLTYGQRVQMRAAGGVYQLPNPTEQSSRRLLGYQDESFLFALELIDMAIKLGPGRELSLTALIHTPPSYNNVRREQSVSRKRSCGQSTHREASWLCRPDAQLR